MRAAARLWGSRHCRAKSRAIRDRRLTLTIPRYRPLSGRSGRRPRRRVGCARLETGPNAESSEKVVVASDLGDNRTGTNATPFEIKRR